MNSIAEQIRKVIDSKTEIRKAKKAKLDDIRLFSWPAFFAGEDYQQELAKNSKILENNTIDFTLKSNQKKEVAENKIKEIVDSTINQKLIQQEEFPVIWFKNIDKIVNKSPLQKSLLTVFDPAQNASLTIQGKTINLSQFILIATSYTHNTGQLSNPLFSRLDCINIETAKPKEFFWDKYFYHTLFAALFVFLTLILMLIYYSDRKNTKAEK